MTNELKLI